jgi:hypothetical protein
MKKVLLAVASMLLLTTGMAFAEDGGLQIDGDYQFKFDSLKGKSHDYMQADLAGGPPTTEAGRDIKNDTLMTNRFGLNLKATPLEDISVKARLVMYKVWGHGTTTPGDGNFFADRAMGVNDGTSGHVPQDNTLRVDYAYTTISNIGDMPLWFSVGRRPSTGGIPNNLRNNTEKAGTAGIPGIMVDYAFDGLTLGFAPDIEIMPGAYAKLCYGKGFDSGYVNKTGASLKDTDFLGLNAALYDTDAMHVEVQYQKGWNIFDLPSDGAMGFTGPMANLGDISWIGGIVTGKVASLNLFFTAAQSKTDPNNNLALGGGAPWGLLWTDTSIGGAGKESHTGTAVYLGGRYDFATGTKIGVEYNQGSQYWMGFVPASDDVWTAKLGTRGNVTEVYVIQELKNKALTKKALAFVKLGYQSYKFDYTGSNNWVGAPVKISDLNTTNMANMQLFEPIEKATDIYLTLEVRF